MHSTLHGQGTAGQSPLEPSPSLPGAPGEGRPPPPLLNDFTTLVRTIEGEIIPRLVLVGASAAPRALAGVPLREPSAAHVARFAALLLSEDVHGSQEFVESLRLDGHGLESIYLQLFAPTARRLGELWQDDDCDFTQVTLGLCRLHQLLREFSPAFQLDAAHAERGRRALLVPTLGEQHTFGLAMVREFLRRAGWAVHSEYPSSAGELLGLVRAEWFAVVGFSLARVEAVEQLALDIRAVRRASCNRNLGVIVGGRIFVEHPEFVVRVGADGMAIDGRQAALQAESVLTLLAARS